MRAVAIFVLSTAVLSVAPRSKAYRALFVLSVVGAAMLLLLIDGPASRWISMAIGVPSISSIAWLADIACTRALDRPLFSPPERRTLIRTMAILALVLYPTALGYVNVDVYHAGFSALAPLLVAGAGIALAVHREFRLALFALAVLVFFNVQLLPSNNLFDYIVDPLGGVCAAVWTAVQAAKWLSARTLMRSRAGAFDAEAIPGPERRRPAAHGAPH